MEGVGDDGIDMHVGTANNTVPDEVVTLAWTDPGAGSSWSVSAPVSSSAMGWNKKSLEMPPHMMPEEANMSCGK